MRNHFDSDWHDDMNYRVMSDDVLRFADEHFIDTFTLLGHSMGGRAALHLACRYLDRVKGLISIDSAPVDESANWEDFNRDVKAILSFMSVVGLEEKREAIVEKAKLVFPERVYIHQLIRRLYDQD